jgi:hypothetical protein
VILSGELLHADATHQNHRRYTAGQIRYLDRSWALAGTTGIKVAVISHVALTAKDDEEMLR